MVALNISDVLRGCGCSCRCWWHRCFYACLDDKSDTIKRWVMCVCRGRFSRHGHYLFVQFYVTSACRIHRLTIAACCGRQPLLMTRQIRQGNRHAACDGVSPLDSLWRIDRLQDWTAPVYIDEHHSCLRRKVTALNFNGDFCHSSVRSPTLFVITYSTANRENKEVFYGQNSHQYLR